MTGLPTLRDADDFAVGDVAYAGIDAGNLMVARMTPLAVSKLLSRLETRLQARLLNRTTRRLTPTPEGHSFYEQCVRILADVEDAERSTSGQGDPRGRLRVSASVPLPEEFYYP